MSFWDDVVSYTSGAADSVSNAVGSVTDWGAGVLDDVGESMGSLFSYDGATKSNTNTSANPAATAQADTPLADNYGNAVTVPQSAALRSSGQWISGVSNGVVIGGAVAVFGLLAVLVLKR